MSKEQYFLICGGCPYLYEEEAPKALTCSDQDMSHAGCPLQEDIEDYVAAHCIDTFIYSPGGIGTEGVPEYKLSFTCDNNTYGSMSCNGAAYIIDK